MRFYLTYRGQLASNGTPTQKHDLRRHFHRQLGELWKQKPLSGHLAYIGRTATVEASTRHDDGFSVIESIGEHHFAPLVTDKLDLLCELEITMLRPEEPGSIISGGDIDNRLKTLFDALSVPPYLNQIPPQIEQTSPADPMLCLVKDDHLISSVSVRCDRLLDASKRNEVMLLIHVEVRATRVTFGNIGISS